MMTWEKWIAWNGEAFEREHSNMGSLDAVKGAYEDGFKAGSANMTTTYGGGTSPAEGRSQSWKKWIAAEGDAFERAHRTASTMDAVEGAFKDGFRDGYNDMIRQYGGGGGGGGGEKKRDSSGGGGEKKRDSSGGGSGPKVLKKGDAGHGGGKKKRRRY